MNYGHYKIMNLKKIDNYNIHYLFIKILFFIIYMYLLEIWMMILL